ncbi:terminal uridylyltransferase 7 isoform X2 [Protopterus annectens]|uniref:terminal uridylyltransferase 7 isoform X2 n=1 Tax=Protopterus annectens TaxID=7888 RepID=UPI001CF9E6FD|nr:terminal uridylyltransferase 7 isoform X2 [Protopterus annectens]
MEDAGRYKFSNQGHRGEEKNNKEVVNVRTSSSALKTGPVPLDLENGPTYKSEKLSQKKKATCDNSPRKGTQCVTISPSAVGSSPRAWHNNGFSKELKALQTYEHYNHSCNWRDRKSPSKKHAVSRPRNESAPEMEGIMRQLETSEKGKKSVRRQLQKELLNEDMSSVTAEGNKKRKKSRKPKRARKSESAHTENLDVPVIDESQLSEEGLLGLHQAEDRLQRDFIFRLKWRPRNYPTIKYRCKLCDILIESITSAHKHIKEKRHKKNLQAKREEELLTSLPPPTVAQVQAAEVAIEKVVQEFGLSNTDVEHRCKIVQIMKEELEKKLRGCTVQLYGSSLSRFGFKDSDVNIDVSHSMSQPDVLLEVQDALKSSEYFENVDTDFHVRIPVVVCTEKQSGLVCRVSAGNLSACETTEHLAAIAQREHQLIPLVVAFRYWAKLCCIDKPDEGGLPPYVLALLVIFFLQQRKEPVLPVYFGLWIKDFSPSRLAHYSLEGVDMDEVRWSYSEVLDDRNYPDVPAILKGRVQLTFPVDQQCNAPLGLLWTEMFRFFALEFNFADHVISIRVKDLVSRELKDWPKKRFAIEDPYSVKRNVARTVNSQLVYEYVLHCLKTSYKYFALPHERMPKSGREIKQKLHTDELQQVEPHSENLKSCHPLNGQYIGNISLDIIGSPNTRPFLGDHQTGNEDCVVNSTESSSEELEACMKTLEVKDNSECSRMFQVCSSEEVNAVGDDATIEKGSDNEAEWPTHFPLLEPRVDEDSETGELANPPYLCTEPDVETESLSDLDDFPLPTGVESDDLELEDGDELEDKEDTDEESLGSDELDNSVNKFVPEQLKFVENSEDDDEEYEDLPSTYEDSKDAFELKITSGNLSAESSVDYTTLLHREEDITISSQECLDSHRNDEANLFYEFSKYLFTKGKVPTVVCSLCRREGHLKKDCPEDFKKLQLDTLPSMTPQFLKILDEVCCQCYDDFAPDPAEDLAREYIRQNLENFIRQEFPGARLSLFGSSKNGFGFKQSDLDICMTFEGKASAKGMDCIRIIENLAKVLKKHPGLRNILSITTAKVPIVKFIHSRSGLEGDISLYNTLALHNTRLLAAYAAIDPRVKYLCYTVKVFAKICDIGDASRGSLSSYAYTLMMLYFLQQRIPSIIPVLQEIYGDRRTPAGHVDNWNVYFFSDLEKLKNRWADYGKNTESVGELWLGFLRFYTEEFDFKEHVISIRSKNLLTTFKKQWTSKYIVIEDPFDLNHNLGAGLSRKMTNFILKAFINGRRVFGTPVKSFPKEYNTKMEYFFDPEVLTEGELAPNDRCCRICGKIGHFRKECPLRWKLRMKCGQEDSISERYHENRLKQTQDGKDYHVRDAERELPLRDGKSQLCTPKKSRYDKGMLDSGRDKTVKSSERWRRLEDREFREKCCFVCGMEGHLKKDCQHYKSPQDMAQNKKLGWAS